MHYQLGKAVESLRDENIVIIGAGMSVHNLRDYFRSQGSLTPQPYSISFDEHLKEVTESAPDNRQALMAEAVKRPDARQAHPVRLEHYHKCSYAVADISDTRPWTI
jgi:4,5-DOPA dioxygenase extradiol